MMRFAAFALVLLMQTWPGLVFAQTGASPFEAGVHVSSATSGQFDTTDLGVGGRFAWYPIPSLGIESELSIYPGEFPDEPPFSRDRIEGLFGVTIGPRIDRVRPFARLRSGFLNIREAEQPFACILIYPPPLACALAAGRTLPVFDLGGGVELLAGERVRLRLDAGDRLLKYPGPVLDTDRGRRDDGFFSHDLRIAAGLAFRFW
jgi:hypothetical protein